MLVLAFHLSSALTLALITASRLLNGASLGRRSMCSRHKCRDVAPGNGSWSHSGMREESGVTSDSHQWLNAHFASVFFRCSSLSPNSRTRDASVLFIRKTLRNVPNRINPAFKQLGFKPRTF